MKNQLRKATLRAAALTMSATIAATSMPLTALAQDDDEPKKENDPVQEAKKYPEQEAKKESESNATDTQKKVDEDTTRTSEEETATALENADTAVDAIVPGDSIKDTKTKDGATVGEHAVNAQTATDNALTKEKNVTEDVNLLVEGTKTEIENNIANLDNIVSQAEEIVSNDNDRQSDLNTALANAQDEITKAQYKEDATKAYSDAITEEAKVSKAHKDAITALENKKNELTEAENTLKNRISTYNSIIATGLGDLEKVQNEIAEAESNVAALEAELTNLENDVKNAETAYNTAKSDYDKSAAKYYSEKYKEAETDAAKEEVFKELLKDWYIPSIDKDAKVCSIGLYNKETGLYDVVYESGDTVKTVYVSFAYDKDGITISKQERVVTKEAVEEHYTCDGLKYSVADYDRAVANKDKVLEYGNDFYLIKADNEYVKVGENNVDSIDKVGKKISDDGSVITYTGDVTKVTKTAYSLDTSENKAAFVYSSADAAKIAGEEYVKTLFEDGVTYENVVVEAVEKITKTTTWSATATYIEKKHKDINGVTYLEGYGRGDTINSGRGLVINAEEDRHMFTRDWSLDYIDNDFQLKSQNVKYYGLITFLNKRNEDEILKEINEKLKAEGNGGCAVYIDWVDGKIGNSKVYYVEKGNKTVSVESKYESEEAAKKAVEDKLKDSGIQTANGAGITATSKENETKTYAYKITATKVVTDKSENETIREVSVAKFEHVDAQKEEAYFTRPVSTSNTFIKDANSAIDDISDKKTVFDNKNTDVENIRTQISNAKTSIGEAKDKASTLQSNLNSLKIDVDGYDKKVASLNEEMGQLTLKTYDFSKEIKAINEQYDGKHNRPSSSSNNGNNNNNNNTNNNPTPAVLPVAPVRPVTPAQQIVELTDDQTPLSATADDTVAPKTNKKAAKKNAAKTTDSDSKKANKKAAKKQPKKVTPEVEDDTMDEDLEIVSLDDNDQVPLAPGVASNDSTKDIMDETSSVSWLWLIILAVASVVTFGTYKGVKKHNENKGKNNR